VLAIRNEQLRVLVPPLQALIERLALCFAKQWPAQTSELGDDYRPFLEAGIKRAASYDIRSEQAIARFVNLYFVWGPKFEEKPEHAWAMKVLKDKAFDGNRKVEELVRRTKLKLRVQDLNKRPAAK
jgi:hypothetical protein